MEVRLDFKNGTYAVITKGGYGFNLEIFTPTKTKEAKSTHSSNVLFYPTFYSLTSKLVWLGLGGKCVNDLSDSVTETRILLSNQLSDIFNKGEK